jgi:hypothetical protein
VAVSYHDSNITLRKIGLRRDWQIFVVSIVLSVHFVILLFANTVEPAYKDVLLPSDLVKIVEALIRI